MDRGQKLIMLGVILAVLIAPAVAYEGQINSVSKWQANPCYGHWENSDNWVKDGCQETWHIWDSDYNDRQPTFVLNIDGEFAPSTGCFTFENRIIVYHEGSKVSDSGWHTDESCQWEDVLWLQGDGVYFERESQMGDYRAVWKVRADGLSGTKTLTWDYEFVEGDIDGDGYQDWHEGCPRQPSNEDGVWGSGQYSNVWDERKGCPEQSFFVDVPAFGDASNDLTVSFNIWSAGDGIDCRLSWGDGTTDTFLLTKNDFASYDNWYKKSVSHTFDDWGSYDIGLTCSDDDGHQESDTATTIQLIPPPPSLSMDLGHGSSSSDKTVQVEVEAQAATKDRLSSCKINWGDGNTKPLSMGPSGGYDSVPFTHTYSSDGTKTVSFSCQTVDGASESISSSITLGSCSPTPKSQACSGKACGSASDGCGGSYSCGSCGGGKVCSNNQCIPTGPSCSDQCNSGAQRCSGNSVQTCGDYDSDPCTEWSTTATCGQHEQCSSGSCNTVDSDGDGVPDHRDDCPNDAGATTDSDGDGYCDANEACDSTGNRYPGNYNNAYCSDRYRWVCNSDETRAKEKQNRWAPICGSGCSSGNWNTVTTESPPTSQYACRDPDGDGGSDAAWKDVVPPTTTDSADTSWHRRNQVITLTCRDEPGGSGCSTTTFCVDQTNSCTPSTQGEDVTVSSEGKNKLRYRSTDVAGNMESIQVATVLIDKSPPTLDCDDCLPDETVPDRAFQIDPSVSDRYSGVRSVTFCADRQCQQILCSGTSCSATFTERGTKEIWAQVTDQVGNTESVQVGSIAVKRPIGKVCTRDSQCISGNCRENVCRPRAKAPIIDIL